ncbi:MAG: Gfo/Idh/MocA family oxidoreductase, partial [Anaerolineae bacterium]|nr:Gfo/Idh/MocA family oxidoreductase [Anaerolineae bacterium]
LTALRDMGERVEFVAAVDVDEARVKAICAEHNIPRWYSRTAEMLAAEKPDLVHIVTPPATHKNLIIECLEAGAWVFCEKPLCASLAEFDELSAVEDRTGKYVSTVFQWRFGSAAQHLRRLMQAQAFGKSLVGVCNTLWFRNGDYYSDPWRGKWATEIGGPAMTLGIHLTDLFLWLMGDWQEIRAMTGTLDRAIEVEDVSMAMVKFASGAMGSITNSVLSPRQESYLRLDFQQATVEVSALYRYNNENWRFSSGDQTLVSQWQALTENAPGGHSQQLCQLLDSLDRQERPAVSGDDARRILEFTTSLYKAAFSGQPVMRGSIVPGDPFYTSMHGAS